MTKVEVINNFHRDTKYISVYIYTCVDIFYQIIIFYYMSNTNTHIRVHKFSVKPNSSHSFDHITIRLHERLTFCHNKNTCISDLEQLMPSLLRFLHRLCRVLFSLGHALVT